MIILYFILSLWITWVFYTSAMNLKRNRAKISRYVKPFAYMTLFVGLIIDFLFQMIFGTLLFLELPKELLFSGRVQRHARRYGWRQKQAIFWATHFLNPFDPSGDHIDR